jgi:hypothetical protein
VHAAGSRWWRRWSSPARGSRTVWIVHHWLAVKVGRESNRQLNTRRDTASVSCSSLNLCATPVRRDGGRCPGCRERRRGKKIRPWEEDEEEFITSGEWRGKHNSLYLFVLVFKPTDPLQANGVGDHNYRYRDCKIKGGRKPKSRKGRTASSEGVVFSRVVLPSKYKEALVPWRPKGYTPRKQFNSRQAILHERRGCHQIQTVACNPLHCTHNRISPSPFHAHHSTP